MIRTVLFRRVLFCLWESSSRFSNSRFPSSPTQRAKLVLLFCYHLFFSCPGRIFSYCGRARAYTHVLARVYSTRASTCTIYMCFTLPHTRVNLTGLQLWGFQRARSFVTEIRTSMLSNKCFTGAYVLNWSHFCCIIIFWGCPTVPILHFLTISNGEGAGSNQCKKMQDWHKTDLKLTQKESWSLDFFRFSSWTPQNELWN